MTSINVEPKNRRASTVPFYSVVFNFRKKRISIGDYNVNYFYFKNHGLKTYFEEYYMEEPVEEKLSATFIQKEKSLTRIRGYLHFF